MTHTGVLVLKLITSLTGALYCNECNVCVLCLVCLFVYTYLDNCTAKLHQIFVRVACGRCSVIF